MRNDLLEMMLAILVLAAGAGCEDLLPKIGGLGFPFLLSASVCLSRQGRLSIALLFAVSAGAAEESLSSLPPMSSVSFFLVTAALVRRLGLSWPGVAAIYPIYQLWLSVWVVGLNVFSRILLAVPVGLLTACAVFGVLDAVRRKAAIDEPA